MITYIFTVLAILLVDMRLAQANNSCPVNFVFGYLDTAPEEVKLPDGSYKVPTTFAAFNRKASFRIADAMGSTGGRTGIHKLAGKSDAEQSAIWKESDKLTAAIKDKKVIVAYFTMAAPKVGDSVTIIARTPKKTRFQGPWWETKPADKKWGAEKIKGKVIYDLGSGVFEGEYYRAGVTLIKYPVLIEVNMDMVKYAQYFQAEYAMFIVDNPILGDGYYIEEQHIDSKKIVKIGIRYGKNNYLYENAHTAQHDRLGCYPEGAVLHDTFHLNENGVDKICAKIAYTILPFPADPYCPAR